STGMSCISSLSAPADGERSELHFTPRRIANPRPDGRGLYICSTRQSSSGLAYKEHRYEARASVCSDNGPDVSVEDVLESALAHERFTELARLFGRIGLGDYQRLILRINH